VYHFAPHVGHNDKSAWVVTDTDLDLRLSSSCQDLEQEFQRSSGLGKARDRVNALVCQARPLRCLAPLVWDAASHQVLRGREGASMFSPRKPESEPSTSSPPTPRSNQSLLSSLSKMLWSPSASEPSPARERDSLPPDASGFMTQSPRRVAGSPTSPDVGASSSEGGSSDKRGLLDIFSPMFTIFSSATGSSSKAPDSRPTAAEEAAATEAVAQQSAAPAPQTVPAPPPEEEDEEDTPEDDDVDEFDPYTFIRHLPPRPPVLARPICLPKKTRGTHPISLILDLDETLLHSSIAALQTYDIVFPVHFNAINYQVYVRKRPHMDYFMNRVSQLFEIIVFTASQKVYADRLLNIIDPQRKWIKHRVFRDSCVIVDGNYLKDLTVLGRDLSKSAIVDNSPQAFGFQLDNGIPIESWFDDPDDTELLKLLPFLESLAARDVDDVRPLIRQQFQLYKKVQGTA